VLTDIIDSGEKRKQSKGSIRDETNSSRVFKRKSDGKPFSVEEGKISPVPDDD
jgi:hypothetical protein